jgi:peptidoglycan/xylan/chitin deacetylase (PgdA/CDA1 family)
MTMAVIGCAQYSTDRKSAEGSKQNPVPIASAKPSNPVPLSSGGPPQLVGGSERASVRPAHTQHIDYSSLYPGWIYLKGPSVKAVALTFDDGPDAVWTPKVLDMLKRYKVRATFMCIGQRIHKYPNVFKRIVREGHVIGNHSWDHPKMTKLSPKGINWELTATNQEIKRQMGLKPRLFRPPYGDLNRTVINEVKKQNMKIIYWNVDSLDWDHLTAKQVVHNVLSHVTPGAIILQHSAGGKGENLDDTVQALPQIIQSLRKEGYRFVTVPELLHLPSYNK